MANLSGWRLLPDFDVRGFLRDLIKENNLTLENLKSAEVVHTGSKSARLQQGYLSQGSILHGTDNYFPVKEYPPNVQLLPGELGAVVEFRGFRFVVVRYTEDP